jgi:hypothetical protein
MYLSPLLLTPLAGRKWEVAAPFLALSTSANAILIPKGFVCDLNSIPRFLWWASTPSDYAAAGVLHDWGYAGNLGRKAADCLYRETLAHLGMSFARRNLRYWALRTVGRFAYKG